MITNADGTPAIAVLYVEDHRDSRELLSSALASRFPLVRFLVAENGAVGLELFRLNLPDIVITDLLMPVLDGISMSTAIKEIAPETVFIVLSARCDAHDLNKALELGVNQFVPKPVEYGCLFPIIAASIHRVTARRKAEAPGGAIPEGAAAAAPARVLLVDDDTVTLFAYRRIIESYGYRVDCCETLPEALALIGTRDYRAAIVDLRLSGSDNSDGFEVLRCIRNRQPGTRVMIWTGFASRESAATAVALGAFRYFEKPVPPEQILEVLNCPSPAGLTAGRVTGTR